MLNMTESREWGQQNRAYSIRLANRLLLLKGFLGLRQADRQ